MGIAHNTDYINEKEKHMCTQLVISVMIEKVAEKCYNIWYKTIINLLMQLLTPTKGDLNM